jgi:guanylate kinase
MNFIKKKKGLLFIVSAPSGAGKSTLLERVRRIFPDMLYSVSCTTRKPRPGEIDGVHYFFVDDDKFSRMVREDGFLEWKEVHGNRYGTPAKPVNDCLEKGGRMILDIDVLGAAEVFRKIPEAVGVFVVAPDMETLEQRLRCRGTESEESVRIRLANARQEMEADALFQYRIVNDSLESAVEELASIIARESGGRAGRDTRSDK